MPRELVLGNGRLLVTFDAAYTLRDFYFPHVGKENHTIGHPSRTGVWVDGRFSWFSDPGWNRSVRYRRGSLVSDVLLEHAGLGLRIHAADAVPPDHTILVRSFQVSNLAGHPREVRLLFHHDFHISESEIGDTAYYEPVNRFLIHYKGRRYFVMNGRTGDGQGIFQYATGQKESPPYEGTWRDAEDGWLEMNPIAQGSVDSTVSFRQTIGPGQTGRFDFWIVAEKGYWEAKALNVLMLGRAANPAPADAAAPAIAIESILDSTHAHWRTWIARSPREIADLPESVARLFRRSLLLIHTQIDHEGAILAANDGDSMMCNRDTYSYMWPRDGALVAHTLDCVGYTEITERFFRFCERLMPRPSHYPEGYLLHKFNPDGSLGSSWHPWARDGRPSLPVQEDETALVLWAFWRHFERRRDSDRAVYDLVRELAPTLVVPAARFMLIYRDEPEGRRRFKLNYDHEPTGLPLASYDLWEERYGIHMFTVVATCAGLSACAKLLRLIAERRWAEDPEWSQRAALDGGTPFSPARCQEQVAELAARCEAAQARMKAALTQHLWSAERGSYARMLTFGADGSMVLDPTLDASTLYALVAFGVFGPDERGVRETIQATQDRLWCKTAIGGVARYENDYYHRQSNDLDNVPGNPWFICTLWTALARLFLAGSADDLCRPKEILQWVCDRARPSGVLAEQVHPYTGDPMSVAPLTWSHAAFAETVLAYGDRHAALASGTAAGA